MRLFSWYGLSALLIALGCGYVAGVAHRTTTCESCFPLPPIPSHEEEALAPPPGLALETQHLTPPEVIDLTCAPSVVLPFELFTQTSEPPVADAMIRQTTFEVPSGLGDGVEPIPFMPYLETDEFAPTRFHSGIRPAGATATATAIALGYSIWSQK
jgi:hypothetical protein